MKSLIFQIWVVVLFSGCASLVKTSATYQEALKEMKIIAVMPPDVEVYKLTAGGMRELIDEWTQDSKDYIKEALQKHIGNRFGFEVKFVEEDWLKINHKSLWNNNRSLYSAVAQCALYHAYSGPAAFPAKLKNFDYTLGAEIQPLSQVLGADALLFVYGYDHEATAGRVALIVWRVLLGAASGSMVIPINPSAMFMGLVNGKTGNLEWFKATPAQVEYSFRSQKHMDILIEWITRDLVRKE